MFDAIRETLRKLIKAGYADEQLINTILKDIQKAMLLSDVDVKLVFEFTSRIKNKLKQEKHASKEKIISIIYDELVKLVGEQGYKVNIVEKPFKMLLVGLFGSGKTTTAGKLAKFFKKRGFKVALLALDTFRPAAVEQLQQIGNSIDVPVLAKPGEKDPVEVIKSFNLDKYDIVIADSAGRDALDEELRKEIARIKAVLNPQEILLVMPADIGQNAKQQAEEFHKLLGITGIIVTKTDGTAKAGGALTACATTNAHIKFIGTGEKMPDLEEFDPKRYISRLLGMGDLETLLEKAKDLDKEKIETVGKKMLRGDFTLLDLYEQLEAMNKMGPLDKIASLIPGLSMSLPTDKLKVQESKLKQFKYVIQSMTKEELENPKIINSSRINRIAKGAGVDASVVKELLQQYNQMKKLMKMGGRNMKRLAKKLGINPSMLGGSV